MGRCKFKPARLGFDNCNRVLSPDNKTGLCHVHYKNEVRRLRAKVSHEPKAKPAPVPCANCRDMTPPKRLIGGHCYKCRTALRSTPVPQAPQNGRVRDADKCSVAGCELKREYRRTCWEHIVRFDHPILAPRPRAEDYMYRNRDIREGVSDGH